MESTTPLSALYFQSGNNPEGIALIAGRELWSYRRLALAVEQVARALYARGVRKGDRVALHMFNVPELAIAYFACFRVGAIAAPLNTKLETTELRAVLQRLEPSVYIGQAQLYAAVAGVETNILAADARYVVGGAGGLAAPRPWRDLLEAGTDTAPMEFPDVDSPAVLLCTSGTTGLPKLVTHTAATLTAGAQACGQLGLERPQIAINMAPMVHASGFFLLLAGLRFGAIQVLIERFDADAVLNAIERYYATWVSGLPFMFVELMRRQRVQPRKVDSLEFCATGGDLCPQKLQQEFPDVFGVHLRSFWAASEVVGALIHGMHCGPVSRIAPGAQVRLVDDNGLQVQRGAVGEMWVRGPYVTVGYWVSPDRLDPATTAGWYRSGDLLRQGEQDDLWFVARKNDLIKKDLIIRGGSNIAPGGAAERVRARA